MIYPTERVDDTILWHLDVAHNGVYSTFPQGAPDSPLTDQSVLDFGRHIIGWSEQARHNAGSAACNYEMGPTDTRQADIRCALHTSILTPATPIPRGQPFQIMKGQYPSYRISHELPTVIRRLGRRFACFWEVDEQRAWLMDGTTALAHLVRGSIASDKTQTPEFLQLETNSLHEPSDQNCSNASGLFICHASNQQIPILRYPNRGEMKTKTFEDRVAQSYHLLDSAFTYQEELKKSIKGTPRTLLEGWDFHDLTWRRDEPQRARFTILDAKANGWVNLLREIDAITIFGQGFGELIEPISDISRPLCDRWTTLPVGHCYMAASHAVLRKIIVHYGGNGSTSPAKLTRRTSLTVPTGLFDCCECRSGETGSKPVQILWPTKMLDSLDYAHDTTEVYLAKGDGAMVFGNNEAHDWYWPDHGHPQRGRPPAPSIGDDSDSDGSVEYSSFTGATDSLQSQSMTSSNTSISMPNKSVSQPSQYHQNAYGQAKVDGDGRLVMGNVYITNNNNAMAGADFMFGYPPYKVTGTNEVPSQSPPTSPKERGDQLPLLRDTTGFTANAFASRDASEDPCGPMESHGKVETEVTPNRWTSPRIGFQIARAFSQPWLEPGSRPK